MNHLKYSKLIGKTITHYKIIEKLGWGGMGIVYKAKDLKLERFVALKFLPTELSLDEEAREKFVHEAKAASSLQHQNICTIHEINTTEDGQLFISMDFYEGETLKTKINNGLFNVEEAVEILINILEGLSAAHEKGIVHRDIKPSNIFITEKNKVKILDFGLAKSNAYTKITRMDRTAGTIAYISPEQAQGKEATQLSDIWSLGVVMYEMLTGDQPFKGEYDQVIIYSILDKEPQKITAINKEVPIELEKIVSKALDKDPDSRYQNAEEMLDDLRNFKNKSSNIKNAQSVDIKKRKKSWIKTSILTLLFIVLAVYFVNQFIIGEKTNHVPVTIAVVSFENQTGDSSYNYLQKAIPNLLITNLEQSGYLQVTTWERMYDLLKQIGKEEVEVIDKELGFELCRMDGIDAIVLGSFVKAGDVFATDVKVLDASTKKLIKSANTKSEGLASILENQIDYLSEEIAEGVGLSAREIESVQLRIADVSTTSMEAYKYFLRGREEYDRYYLSDAIKYFEKSVKIDSTFAVAHLYMGLAQGGLYEINSRNEAFSKAEKFKSRATDREKVYIEAFYLSTIERNREKSINVLEQGLKKYPREKIIHLWLGRHYNFVKKHSEALKEFNKVLSLDPEYGFTFRFVSDTYTDMGEYEKALENMNKYISFYPDNADSYNALGYLFFKIGKIDKAIDQFKKALKVKNDFGPSAIISMLFALKEDYSEGLKWQDKIIKMRSTESLKVVSIWWKSFSLYWTGNIKQALRILEKIVKTEEHVEDIWIARVNWLKGWIYYDKGRFDESQKYFKNYSKYTMNRGFSKAYSTARSYCYIGLTDLGMGKIDSVRNSLKKMNSISRELDGDQFDIIIYHYNLLYSMVLIKEDSLNKAEDILKNSTPFKISPNYLSSWRITAIISAPLLKDGLAQIYIKKGELNKAIKIYEELISHDSKIRGQHLIHPKYHYRIAKLYEEKDWKKKAVAEFEKFLEIWKDADKDLPELIDAKKRLAGLIEK